MSIPHTPRKKARIHVDPDEGQKKQKHQNSLQKQREQLPIAKGNIPKPHSFSDISTCDSPGKDALVREIRDNDVVILLGETGSGKTTRTWSRSFVPPSNSLTRSLKHRGPAIHSRSWIGGRRCHRRDTTTPCCCYFSRRARRRRAKCHRWRTGGLLCAVRRSLPTPDENQICQ